MTRKYEYDWFQMLTDAGFSIWFGWIVRQVSHSDPLSIMHGTFVWIVLFRLGQIRKQVGL